MPTQFPTMQSFQQIGDKEATIHKPMTFTKVGGPSIIVLASDNHEHVFNILLLMKRARNVANLLTFVLKG